MEARNPQRIQNYLADEAVQRRVQQNIQRSRKDLAVTIGRASELSGFSISQLRDLERKGLLNPFRPELADAKSATGQRQYPVAELEKLAIIRELTDADFPTAAIPTNISEIWAALQGSRVEGNGASLASPGGSFLPINQRVDVAYFDSFYWRFYASRALQMVLMLVSEDVPGTYSGLVLPAREWRFEGFVPNATNLAEVGESLVGWLGQTRSFCTLLAPQPALEYPSDFRIVPLLQQENEQAPRLEDRTLVLVQRDEAKKLNFAEDVLEVARRLLRPIYEDRDDWQRYFGEGMQDLLSPGIDFTPRIPDRVLTGLANMLIRLGGKASDGEDRWRFCYILLPENSQLPLQQRSLVIRAMSQNVHHKIGVTKLAPERYRTSLSIRAFQSSSIIYRQELSQEDVTPDFREIEGPVRSNIAVPIGGETDEPLGVLYVAAYTPAAFSQVDFQLLRIMARMIEELLSGYLAHKQLTRSLTDLVKIPRSVDTSFKDLGSENDFIDDIETLLKRIQELTFSPEEVARDMIAPAISGQISFIAIDIDDQDRIVRDHDEQMLRNLQRTIGQRIRDLLPALFSRYLDCKLYYIYAGRFYLLLHDFSLEETKRYALRLKKALEGNVAIKRTDLLRGTHVIPDVSLHLAVTWYSYEKLQDFLVMKRQQSIADVSAILYRSLDSVLKLGMDEGGDVVYAWEQETRSFTAYQPDELRK
ncbi:MAG: MerR family transcriptional regulator [Chloroflexota bacterium]|nr:MerR family transcriptional regulator [Chloroflexota bacterium]